jgi:hypothetical protein
MLVLMEKVSNGNNKNKKMPTPYLISFQMDFVTNLTENIDTDTAFETSSWPAAVIGKLFYDWSIQKQRIDHGAGANECQHFYNTDKACSLIFNHVGMYRLILDDDKHQAPVCCLDLAGIGTPPPDWAQSANGTFNGVQFDYVSGVFAFQWTFDRLPPPTVTTSPLSMNRSFHTVREVALGQYTGRPLTFTFPGKAEGRQDYHFDVKSMRIGPQRNASIFDIPNDCINRLCEAAAVGMLSGV